MGPSMFGSVGIELSMLLKLYEFANPAKPTAKQTKKTLQKLISEVNGL